MAFNIFGPADKKSVKVGYIDPQRGYIIGVSVLEANKYAALNPGTQFIVSNREVTRFLNINEVNALEAQDLIPSNNASADPDSASITRGLRPGEVLPRDLPTKIVISGSGGIGAVGNPIFGKDGSLLAVQVVNGGFGYTAPPLVRIRDATGLGAGAVVRALIGNTAPTLETFSDEDDFEIYDFSGDTPLEYGDRFGPNGENLGKWDPNLYATLAADPIKSEVKKYQDFLREVDSLSFGKTNLLSNGVAGGGPPGGGLPGSFAGETTESETSGESTSPSSGQPGAGILPNENGIAAWWNTRKQTPIAVTFRERTTRTKYDVSNWRWGGEIKNKPNDSSTPPSVDQNFDEVQFEVFSQLGNTKEHLDSGLALVFTAKDKSHSFRFDVIDYINPDNPLLGKKTKISKKVKKNTTYNVTSEGKFAGKKTERGLVGTLGRSSLESGIGKGKIAFADLVGSANDNDDLQVRATQGIFTSSNRIKDERSSYDLTYEYTSTSTFKQPTKVNPRDFTIDDSFMNRYAISPVPPSNAPGSAFAGQWATFEWEEFFPYTGEYVIRGMADNISKFYLDNELLIETRKFKGAPTDILKTTVKEGTHRIKIDLYNIPITQRDNPPANRSVTIQKFDSIFNTLDYIKKADRKLWRTNVYGRGGFLNEYGICPFNTRVPLPDNPYAGVNPIIWENVDFPQDGNYKIEIDVDDSVELRIGTRKNNSSKDVIIEKDGFTGKNGKPKGKETFTKFFKKGKYRIKADLRQEPGGRFSFDPKSQDVTKEPSVSARFVRKGVGKYILKVEGSGSAKITFNCQINDDTITLGDPSFTFATIKKDSDSPNSKDPLEGPLNFKRTIEKSNGIKGKVFKKKESIVVSGTFEAGRDYTVKINGITRVQPGTNDKPEPRVRSGSIQCAKKLPSSNVVQNTNIEAELFIRKIKSVDPAPIKGINPMALAINITPQALEIVEIEQPRVAPSSWSENPMGTAFTIDAPLPPIPQEPIPVSEGRCPNNPLWTSRFPGASEKWYPIFLESKWSDFMNRFAISPIPPLSIPNSDGSGVVYRTTWNFEAPFSGFYGLKGAGDGTGQILVNEGRTYTYKLKGFDVISPPIEKFFLEEGQNQITLEIENELSSDVSNKVKNITKKIFTTKDWGAPGNTNPGSRVSVNFDVYGQGTSTNCAINFVFTSEDGTDSFVFKSQLPANEKPYTYSRKVDVLPNVNYKVEAVSTGNPEVNGKAFPIEFGGLNITNTPIEVSGDGRVLKLKDDDGDVIKTEFTILSTSPGVGARFSPDGKTIFTAKGTGDITLRLKWDDDPASAGSSVKSISVGGKTFKQTGQTGKQTETISLNKNNFTPLVLEQGTLKRGSFAKRVRNQESSGTSDIIFADTVSSANDNDDMQIRASLGDFIPTNKRDITGTRNAVTETRNTYDLTFRVDGVEVPLETQKRTKNINGHDVTYSGPAIFRYKVSRWSEFMNNNNVSPVIEPSDTINENVLGTKEFTWSNVDFPENGEYEILFQTDNTGVVFIDGTQVAESRSFKGTPLPTKVNISRGKYTIQVQVTNIPTNVNIFNRNPTGFALNISKTVTVSDNSLSWRDNPIGVSAVLIPPPCPKTVEGVGVVTSILVDSPGNFPLIATEPGQGFPVTLRLVNIDVGAPGINFSPDDVVVVSTPNRPDIEFSIRTGTFGQVEEVLVPQGDPFGPTSLTGPAVTEFFEPNNPRSGPNISPTGPGSTIPGVSDVTDTGELDVPGPGAGPGAGGAGGPGAGADGPGRVVPGGPGAGGPDGPPLASLVGITEFPSIRIRSNTGIGFRGIPRFEPIVVPEDVLPEQEIIQVTDLVGLKQTGYVNGKPYYGSVFSKNGLLYAGIYESIGKLIQVYPTLQESIDANITTRPSAILRTGSDVTNNDPRLNIPGTPQNLI